MFCPLPIVATSLTPSLEDATADQTRALSRAVQFSPMLAGARLPARIVWLVFCRMIQPAAPTCCLRETRDFNSVSIN